MLPFLQKDIKMVNNQTTNPGTIFYFKQNSGSNYDLEAQGTSLVSTDKWILSMVDL
jgi:hypothetical protein